MASSSEFALLKPFEMYAKYGRAISDGKGITLTQSDKWLKQAHIIDNKTILPGDTGVIFTKHRSKYLSFGQYLKFLQDLSIFSNLDMAELVQKMITCGPPRASPGSTIICTSPLVNRLASGLPRYQKNKSLSSTDKNNEKKMKHMKSMKEAAKSYETASLIKTIKTRI